DHRARHEPGRLAPRCEGPLLRCEHARARRDGRLEHAVHRAHLRSRCAPLRLRLRSRSSAPQEGNVVMNPRPLHRIARSLPFLLLAVALPLSAGAAVKREGTWPPSAQEKKVSFDFDGDPGKGLQELAKEAGWSLVVPKDVTQGAHPVHIDVDD